jgi:hypothetical protein
MYPQRTLRLALRLGLLLTLVVLAMSACAGVGGGGGEEQAKAKEGAKARTLPTSGVALLPGKYYSEEFEPPSPSVSARAGQTANRSCPNSSNWRVRNSQGTYASRT